MTSKISTKTHIVLAIVFIISFTAAYSLPTEGIIKEFSPVPGIFALCGAVFQILRDQSKFEKEEYLQNKEQHFLLGVTSHMANVAFDKHVAFCEEYLKRVHKGLADLFKDGPTRKAVDIANELYNIRLDFSTWVSVEIGEKLIDFEANVRKIGTRAMLMEVGAASREIMDEMYSAFSEVLGLKEDNPTEKVASKIIEHLQDILGTKELTKLRKHIIEKATDNL